MLSSDDELRARARASYYPYEQLLARHIGRDLHQPPDALKPRLAAATAVTGLRELYLSEEARRIGSADPTGTLMPLVDEVLAFASAGITAGSSTVKDCPEVGPVVSPVQGPSARIR